ncbi:MAG: thermosome subunit beta [Candidatus Caldarchaeum sp.]
MSKKYIIRDPFGLLREGVLKSKGYARWRDNILAARAVSDVLKPSLGPKGFKKLITDKFGETAVTNHGFIILDKMDFEHPVGKLLKEAAKTIETSVGDGTKTSIILVGELLYRTDELTSQNLRIGSILTGYRKAYEIAVNRLYEIAQPVQPHDEKTLKQILANLCAARGVEEPEYLASLILDAVKLALRKVDGKMVVDKDAVRLVKKIGGSVRESRVITGVVLDKQMAHPAMPRKIKNAKIALLNMALKIDEFRHLQPYKYHIDINSPALVEDFLREEDLLVETVVNKILATGANVVITRKKMGPVAKQLLAKAGVIGISRLLEEEIFTSVAKITGARVVSSVDELGEHDLGNAAYVGEEKVGEDRVVVIEGVVDSGGATVLVKGPSTRIVDEIEHIVKDAVKYVSMLFDTPFVVPGGGAAETSMAAAVAEEALHHSGVEQLAMNAFARTLESIPKILMENSGQDVLELWAQLKTKHMNNLHTYGYNASSNKIEDMTKNGLTESLEVKKQVLTTAYETASMLLRIDELVDRRYVKRHEGEAAGK